MALRAEFPPGYGPDNLSRVDFVVCPYDGTNLKVAGQPTGLAVPLPMLCPACGRRFEFADGAATEQPPGETEDNSGA
jgi:hypothetical protein